ncbi:MAG: hydrolase 1, exosortase A system-associated [Woeseia sp.]
MKQERPVVFDCAGDRLVGILHASEHDAETGVVIVVGGPQYRVGSHRQFVLMARRFAAAGIPVLRFDVRGMGDSEGQPRSFESLDDDIRAAIDCFTATLPGLTKIVLLGLCDAASANLIYCHTDPRVSGLILLNPWVRTTQGEAKTYLRHYYMQRLLQKTFWRKVLAGEFTVGRSLREFFHSLRAARISTSARQSAEKQTTGSFVERMRSGLVSFRHSILVIISGRDLTAQEFMDLSKVDKHWRIAVRQSSSVIHEFPDADHTLSSRPVLDSVTRCCISWLGETM